MKYYRVFWTCQNHTRVLLPLMLPLPFHPPAYLSILPSIPAPLTRTVACVLLQCVKFMVSVLPAKEVVLCSGNYSPGTACLNPFPKVYFWPVWVFFQLLACLLPKCEHKGESEDLVSFDGGGGVGFLGDFVFAFKEMKKKKISEWVCSRREYASKRGWGRQLNTILYGQSSSDPGDLGRITAHPSPVVPKRLELPL